MTDDERCSVVELRITEVFLQSSTDNQTLNRMNGVKNIAAATRESKIERDKLHVSLILVDVASHQVVHAKKKTAIRPTTKETGEGKKVATGAERQTRTRWKR